MAALLPSRYLTRTTRAAGVTTPPRRLPRSARSLLIGRQGARQSFWDATPLLPLPLGEGWGEGKQPASLATARRPEPLYVFGAAGAPSDNRKTEPRDAPSASSLRDSPNARCARYLLRRSKKVEENQRPSIDMGGHLHCIPSHSALRTRIFIIRRPSELHRNCELSTRRSPFGGLALPTRGAECRKRCRLWSQDEKE